MTTTKKLPPIHPGQILAEDYLREAGLSMNQLARALRVPVSRIRAIVNGQRGITADTALRLARYWDTTPQYWMNLQSLYELEFARDALGNSINQIKPRIEDKNDIADALTSRKEALKKGSRNFKELQAEMSPERQTRNKAEAAKSLAKLLAQCNPRAKRSKEDEELLNSPRIGRELL